MRSKSLVVAGIIGVFLIIYGQLFPSMSQDWSFYMLNTIEKSIQTRDNGALLIISFSYVARYVILFFILYLGSFLVANYVTNEQNNVLFQIIFIFCTLGSIFLLNQLYVEYIPFSLHLLLLSFLLFLKNYLPEQRYYYLTFSIVLILLLISFQWLNLIPALSAFNIGTDDFAIALKIADKFLTGERLFNTLFTVLFVVFSLIAIIFTILVHLFNMQFITLKKYQRQEVELKETRVALVESKVYQEIHTLVHDLKTPLVSVDGLLSLIEMKYPIREDEKMQDYFNRLDRSIRKMNDMISEILYEDIKKAITVDELLRYVTSHLSLDDQKVTLSIKLEDHLPLIQVNKIRFARAISNLLENAILSFKGNSGNIHIHVKQIKEVVLFRIRDDGPGINENHLNKIWKEGFSTKNSTGIGLSFVKRVIENHGGNISVKSNVGKYTQMEIFLPAVQKEV
ncbi:HAMP domain-containing histidine kinase [Aquibacillus sp. 3ASR75-11]|uniref:histidine kinase n=1 Tax=Terrihalobacillus insolitus TaxID=2950438 RepID=A0A9X3WNI6_9BACI|nr:HAMP domain-containing sensor histidine kinase [Terrihalobacillus insolitus]MDC3412275.1 HAMP domain-containing histidine kinase [Terrihalobacillus insolitus]MDC3423032.1 HAMP domain-containing histidine kinase [Terrihalobacillus insolitus]